MLNVNMKGVLVLSVCLSVFIGAKAGLAPFITPCRAADSACLKESAQKAVPVLAAGVPELGLTTLDPMHVVRVRASQAGLNMDFSNTTVKGLRNCQVLSLRRDGNKMALDLKCSVMLVGDYKLGGKLLVMPIEGEGKYKIKIRDIIVKINFQVEEFMKNEDPYWALAHWRHSAEVRTNVEFHFQNLFNGNKQLSDAIHQFANDNWRDIFQEVAPPIVKAIVTQVIEEVKKLFVKVSIKEMVIE